MGMKIAIPGLIGLLCLVATAPPAPAQAPADKTKKPKPLKKINVDLDIGWNGCYRPMHWTPVMVGVTTPFKKALDCNVRFSCQQDDLNALNISRREVFMPGLTRNIPLVTRMTYPAQSAYLALAGTDSPYYWHKTYEFWSDNSSRRPLTALRDHDLLIGLSGNQGFSIMQLPRATASSLDSKQGQVHAEYRFRQLLPSDWTGYASLDLLVLYDVDWLALTIHQQRAIAEYVTNGGRLLMVMGANPLPAGHTFARMLPVSLTAPKEIQLSPKDLRAWNCEQPKTDKVACWQANVAPDAHGWGIKNDRNGNTIFVSGPIGFGKVGVLLFNPAHIRCRPGRQLASFWLRSIEPLNCTRTISLSNSPQDTYDDYGEHVLGIESTAGNSVLEYLYSVEELKPIHIGWVVLVLAGLAVLIGPIDYLVLKAFGRLPWTWITSTACIAVFSVGAYYGVEYLRGGVLQARVVSVVDSVDGLEGAWSTRYMGMFAPHSDDYRLEGMDRKQWWSGMAPIRDNTLYAYRSMGQQSSTRTIYCEQHIDGGNLARSVPINIWSMQCLCSESNGEKSPLAAKAVKAENGQWTVTVQNNGEKPISRCYLRVSQSMAVELGDVPAGESRQFIGVPRKRSSWQERISRFTDRRDNTSNYYGYGDEPGYDQNPVGRNDALNAAELAQGVHLRTLAMMSYLEDGAAVLCAEYNDAPVPYRVKGKKCQFQHTLLARLVVFPEGRK